MPSLTHVEDYDSKVDEMSELKEALLVRLSMYSR